VAYLTPAILFGLLPLSLASVLTFRMH